jgi:hypothetical protein
MKEDLIMKNSAELDKDIKELEDKLSSLKAERQLVKAQESLSKEKSGSLFKNENLIPLIQRLQEKLATSELGLSLSFNYKRNWVFLVRDKGSKDGLASFKVLDLKDKRIFYGLVEGHTQIITTESIQNWLENALKVIDILIKIKSKLAVEPFKVEFKSYDNAFSKLYFSLDGLHDYDCILTMSRPYKLKMSKRLTFDSEYSTIFFLGGGVSLETLANSQYIHDENYLGDFEQKLSVKQSFRKFSELGEIAKGLEEKIALFYEALEPRFD